MSKGAGTADWIRKFPHHPITFESNRIKSDSRFEFESNLAASQVPSHIPITQTSSLLNQARQKISTLRDKVRLTFKHVDAGLGRVSHRVHEDRWKELGEEYSDLWSVEFVSQQLGKEIGGLLTRRCISRVTVEV